MNVDRTPFAVGHAAASGNARTTSSSRDGHDDAPAFSLDVGHDASHGGIERDVPRGNASRERTGRDVVASRIERGYSQRAKAEASGVPNGRDHAEHADDAATRPDEAQAARGRPALTANAKAQRDRADGEGVSEDATADALPVAESGDVGSKDVDRRDAESAPPRETSLADRMLALLGIADAAPPSAPMATIATAASSPTVGSGGLGTTSLATTTTITPAAGGDAAIDSALATAAGAGAAQPGALSGVPIPFAATSDVVPTTASPDKPGDPFAALTAMALKDTKADASTTGSNTANAAAPIAPGFAAHLSQGLDVPSPAARIAAAATVDPSVALALDAGFDDGIGSRVLWMADQRVDHAQIRITPEGLGPIDVRLQMDGQRVHAQFNASHADVRHALEAGMDRLRDLLGRQGMELGQAQVGTGQRQSGDGRPASQGASANTGDDVEAAVQTTTVRAMRLRGLIDEYA